MSEITIEITASTNIVGSKDTCEAVFDMEEWQEMSPEEKDQVLFEIMVENLVNWDYKEI